MRCLELCEASIHVYRQLQECEIVHENYGAYPISILEMHAAESVESMKPGVIRVNWDQLKSRFVLGWGGSGFEAMDSLSNSHKLWRLTAAHLGPCFLPVDHGIDCVARYRP